jgi:thiamine transporter ThiT
MNTDIVILAAVNLKHPCPESFICFGQGCFFLKNKGDWLMKENTGLRKTTLAALFLAIGLILPFITMQIPAVGKMLCPMHIPVLLCGYVCGWPYGLIVGIITPLLRGVLFGMPAIFPNAVCMAFELATYGFVAGILSEKMNRDIKSLYVSLITAMLCGRIVWGLASAAIYALTGGIFTWKLFLMGGFVNALPGIMIQLMLIPVLVERLYCMEGTLEWN